MAARENGTSSNQWRSLLGREVALTRNRYGYRLNGRYLRRVTTLLGGIPKPALTGWAARTVAEFAVEHQDSWLNLPKTDAVKLLKGAPWSVRDDAADRGTAIHAAVEAYLEDRPLPDGLTEEEFDCAVAVEAFLRQHVAKVLAVELTVISVTHEYAGTLDLWALGKDGCTYLLDWKTSGTSTPTTPSSSPRTRMQNTRSRTSGPRAKPERKPGTARSSNGVQRRRNASGSFTSARTA